MRLAVILDLRRAASAPVRLAKGVLDGEHAINRRLEAPGDVGGHHFGEAAVVAEDRKRRRLAFDRDDVAEFDVRSLPRRPSRGQGRRENALAYDARALRQREA